MLSIIAPMICYKNTLGKQAGRESDVGRRAAAAGHAIQIAHRLQSINTYYRAPFVPAHFHPKYYTFLFTVYCYRLFRGANRSATMCPPVRPDGCFQVSKRCNLLHSLIVGAKSRPLSTLDGIGTV